MTLAEILTALDALPLADLGRLAEEAAALFAKKSSEQTEVAAARAAGDVAVDELEKAELGQKLVP